MNTPPKKPLPPAPPAPPLSKIPNSSTADQTLSLRKEVSELKEEVAKLRSEMTLKIASGVALALIVVSFGYSLLGFLFIQIDQANKRAESAKRLERIQKETDETNKKLEELLCNPDPNSSECLQFRYKQNR